MSWLTKIVKTVWSGWFLDGYKTPLTLILLALTKSGIVPEIDVTDGLSIDELLLVWGALDAKLKDYGIREHD